MEKHRKEKKNERKGKKELETERKIDGEEKEMMIYELTKNKRVQMDSRMDMRNEQKHHKDTNNNQTNKTVSKPLSTSGARIQRLARIVFQYKPTREETNNSSNDVIDSHSGVYPYKSFVRLLKNVLVAKKRLKKR